MHEYWSITKPLGASVAAAVAWMVAIALPYGGTGPLMSHAAGVVLKTRGLK
jgi:hypothetical protein